MSLKKLKFRKFKKNKKPCGARPSESRDPKEKKIPPQIAPRDPAATKPQIQIRNSFCTTEGFTPTEEQLIADTLTYDNVEAQYELKQAKYQLAMAFRFKRRKQISELKAKIAELENNLQVCWYKDRQFPTGHLRLIEAALRDFSIPVEVQDLRELNAPQIAYKWATDPKTPRYYQDEAVEAAIINHRGVLACCVGSGKSYISQMIVHALQVPSLIIVPSKDLRTQIGDDYIQAFGKSVVEIISSEKQINTKKPIRICTLQTLGSLRKKGRLKPLLQDLGLLFVDESHHNGCSTFTQLLPYFDHIYYRFGASGSYERGDSKTLDMWGFLSTVIYEYPATKAIAEGFLTPVEVLVHEIPTKKPEGRITYQREYTKHYCDNPKLLSKINEIFDQFGAAEEQTLILVGRKDQSGKIIHNYLTKQGINNTYIDGDSDKEVVRQALQDFNDGKIKTLVGSQIIGEGIDVRSATHLIMAQGGKSLVNITQATGRLVRLYEGKTKGYLHDFRFTGTKYLESHCSERLKIYKNNFGAEIVEV